MINYMAIKLTCLLLFIGTVAGIYVDEPLLYDTFPPDFIMYVSCGLLLLGLTKSKADRTQMGVQ